MPDPYFMLLLFILLKNTNFDTTKLIVIVQVARIRIAFLKVTYMQRTVLPVSEVFSRCNNSLKNLVLSSNFRDEKTETERCVKICLKPCSV